MKRIDEDIKSGNFARAYLLYGKERYLIRTYRDKLKKALTVEGDNMNVSFFQGKEVQVGQIIDLAETLPFLAERRVIFVEDTGLFKSGNDELADYLSGIPETTVLIFVEEEVDRSRRLYKELAKSGHAAEFGTPTEETLARWITGRIQREGKNITRGAYELFIQKTGTDMENITGELEKLICYCLDKEVIETADVEAVTTEQLTSRIFAMVDAIVAKRQRQALDMFYDLLALKESPLRVLALITRQFNLMLTVKAMQNNGFSQKEISSGAKLQSWLVRKVSGQCRNFTLDQIRGILREGVDYEEAVKTGRMNDRMALELFIIRCCGARQ